MRSVHEVLRLHPRGGQRLDSPQDKPPILRGRVGFLKREPEPGQRPVAQIRVALAGCLPRGLESGLSIIGKIFTLWYDNPMGLLRA